mmetsp:Transcript_712/g.2377  ORF Transcript_712/g.2377 Transcript_712/m.2377 type:complete len:171 (-) Transcript_712:83-595(-)
MHYSYKPDQSIKVAKARNDNVRVHYKNTVETCAAVRGRTVADAKTYIMEVLKHKQCVPFKRFNGGPSRTPQAKGSGVSQGRWPRKSLLAVLRVLQNAEANAVQRGMSKDDLYVAHIQANEAPKIRRRTYRAHGRINAYMSSPCHIEIILQERQLSTAAPEDKQDVVATTD